jgi:hypothetical protein
VDRRHPLAPRRLAGVKAELGDEPVRDGDGARGGGEVERGASARVDGADVRARFREDPRDLELRALRGLVERSEAWRGGVGWRIGSITRRGEKREEQHE